MSSVGAGLIMMDGERQKVKRRTNYHVYLISSKPCGQCVLVIIIVVGYIYSAEKSALCTSTFLQS